MPRYKLKANVGWVANSDTEFGVFEFDNEEEAQKAAFEAACEHLSAWPELVEGSEGEE